MFSELVRKIDSHQKTECSDVFMDVLVLSGQCNIEKVVYFFRSIYEAIFENISQSFDPLESHLTEVMLKPLDGALQSVLKKQF